MSASDELRKLKFEINKLQTLIDEHSPERKPENKKFKSLATLGKRKSENEDFYDEIE